MGLLSAVGKIPGFGALSPLFMAADVMSTKVVNEMLNEFSETSLLAWEKAKQGGLNQALMYAQNSDGAKMLGLDVKEFVSQTAYEKLLCGEFKTFEDFNSFVSTKNDDANNWYTCFYFEQEKNEKTKYLIDSIFLRQ